METRRLGTKIEKWAYENHFAATDADYVVSYWKDWDWEEAETLRVWKRTVVTQNWRVKEAEVTRGRIDFKEAINARRDEV